MLLRLKIQNYALISESEITLGEGLTIITGETGAGKSILMGALSLILGARADSSVIKQGEKKTVVEAEFYIKNYNLKQFFDDNDLDYCDSTEIRREILDSGKSRAFVNDTPVTLQTLKELGMLLTEIHSQHQTLEIADEAFQISLLDSYAGNQDLINGYAQKYSAFVDAHSQLQKLKAEAREAAKEAEYLHFRFDELDKAHLRENEQQELEEELEMLSHNEDIKMSIALAAEEMVSAESNTILQKMKSAMQALGKISGYYPRAAELSGRMESSYIELQDIAREISDINENTEYSPERLEFVSERLGVIYNLEKKFQAKTLEDLLLAHKQLADRLRLVDNVDDRIQDLQSELDERQAQLAKVAGEITASRKKAVEGLQREIYELLESLGIRNSQFGVEFSESKDFRPSGRDNVRYMFSANKNVPMADLSKTASGGELSRLMLCLKYILSRSTKLPTIIFDEIDTGISGDVAGKTGAMFRRIAEFMQVICITHLPQVAAMGHRHFKVFKHEVNGAIQSDIRLLDVDGRVREIASMLSGETVSAAALMNATELLSLQ